METERTSGKTWWVRSGERGHEVAIALERQVEGVDRRDQGVIDPERPVDAREACWRSTGRGLRLKELEPCAARRVDGDVSREEVRNLGRRHEALGVATGVIDSTPASVPPKISKPV